MIGSRNRWITAIIFAAVLISPPEASPQLVLGQYEDEAPLGTWNRLGAVTAGAVGMGETRFAQAFDCSAAFTNPSLLIALPGFSAALGGSAVFSSLFRYSLVNTGVLASKGNLTVGIFAMDFGGASFRWKKWAVSAAAAVTEHYDRPGVNLQYMSSGVLSHRLEFNQGGLLRNINIALAREVTSGLSAGIAMNFISGDLRRDITETFVKDGVSRQDQKRQSFRGFFVNAGLSWRISPKVSTALVFRAPFTKKSESRSILTYDAPASFTSIRIEAAARDEYRQPWVAGAGVSWKFADNWRLAADIAFFGWSVYRIRYFDEQLARDFRNTLKTGTGIEYRGRVRLFGRSLDAPLRAGLVYDQQPMRTPRSSYLTLAVGSGLEWERFVLDMAVDFGSERGSGRSLKSGRFAVTLGYHPGK